MSRWILAEFEAPESMLKAAERLRLDGFAELDTHTPYPVHGIEEALGLRRSRVPFIAALGALTGGLSGYAMMLWMNAVDYPINVGNRPPHSLPAFLPITFELTVLICSLSIFFGCLFLFGLPKPWNPVFECAAFASASTHNFWVSVRDDAAGSDGGKAAALLRKLGAAYVEVVEVNP